MLAQIFIFLSNYDYYDVYLPISICKDPPYAYKLASVDQIGKFIISVTLQTFGDDVTEITHRISMAKTKKC